MSDDLIQSQGASATNRRAALTLTARERQVACLRRDGLAASDIASKLGISLGTVERYFFIIGQKTSTHNVAQLIQWLADERNHYASTYCRCGTAIPLDRSRNMCQSCIDREVRNMVPIEVEHGVAELYVLARRVADMPVDEWLGRFPFEMGDTVIRIRKLLTAALELKRVTEELTGEKIEGEAPSAHAPK